MRGRIPGDLLVIIIVAATTPVMALLLDLDGSLIQMVAGFIFIFIAPGYALVSLMVPGTQSTASRMADTSTETTTFTFPKRLLIGVGLSIAIVPLIGVILQYSPWNLDATSTLFAVSVPTLLVAILAVVRRYRLPPGHRFQVTLQGLPEQLRAVLGSSGSEQEARLNLVFTVGVVLAVAGVGTAVALSGEGERYTEFYLETPTGPNGSTIADRYPSDMNFGAEYDFTVGITNQEQQSQRYTVVVGLQRIQDGTVVETAELQRFVSTLDTNVTTEKEITVTPNMVGENLRLSYFLYREDPPPELSARTAYRHLYVWVNVTE